MNCLKHPSVETELACGRCGRPICTRCMVMTPSGQRCRDCANVRRPPMYEVGALFLARGIAAAIGVGLVGGFLWALIQPLLASFLGFFILLLAMGLGYVMGEAVARATNRKRGYALQLAAAFGIVVAYFVRNLLLVGALVIPTDIFGYLSVAIGIFVAINPLR